MNLRKINYLTDNYRTIICLFAALAIIETFVYWTDNYILSMEYPSIVERNNLSLGLIVQNLIGSIIHAFLNLSILIAFAEILGEKWFIVPISILSSFIINVGLSYFSCAHMYFDIRAFNWLAYLFYSSMLFVISYHLINKELKVYYSFVIYYLMFLVHRIGTYLGVCLLSGDFIAFFNPEFYRYLFYSGLFGGVYLLFNKIITKKG
nr:hypothetical protein [uncultured Carboxylicivirga sp.]